MGTPYCYGGRQAIAPLDWYEQCRRRMFGPEEHVGSTTPNEERGEKPASDKPSSVAGFVVAVATGIPINMTAGTAFGMATHHSSMGSDGSGSSDCSSSYDSGSSSSSDCGSGGGE